MNKLINFYNSDAGRKVVNWGVAAFGGLVMTGVLPLEMAIGPFTLGQLLLFLGLRLPSTPPVKESALKV